MSPFPGFHCHSFLFSSRVWDVNTGEVLNTLIHHNEAVLHLRFSNGLMVTCSKDRSIAVWDMASATDITLRRVLVGHRAAVNVVDFDDKYIVSASGDRTIKVSVSAIFNLTIVIPVQQRNGRGGLHPGGGVYCLCMHTRPSHSSCFWSHRQGKKKPLVPIENSCQFHEML